MSEEVMLTNGLSDHEMHILRILRKSPHQIDMFMLAGEISVKLEEMEGICSKLVSLGLIKQNFPVRHKDFPPGYTYFTCENKRTDIDALVEQDFNHSIIDINDIDFVNADMDDITYICLDCGTIHNYNSRYCKNCLRSVVDIDTKILDIILELNRKGYKTSYCCSGHFKHGNSAYFGMAQDEAFETIPIPEGFTKDKNRSVYRATPLQ